LLLLKNIHEFTNGPTLLTNKQKKLLERQEKIGCKILKIEQPVKCLAERRTDRCIEKYKKIEDERNSILCDHMCAKLPRTGKYCLFRPTTERLKNTFFYKTPYIINNT
jgi:hypothetical protein